MLKKGGFNININKLIDNFINYSNNNEFEKIKDLTYKFEKHILNNCKNEHHFKNLLDDLTLYSDYSLLNTLLIKEQYPNFLSLATKKTYKEQGYKINEGVKPVRVLQPITDDKDNFKGLKIINLYDQKDTNMKKSDYRYDGLPPLYTDSYENIYNSFVKALYSDGYKIKYSNMNQKVLFDKESKIINLNKGVNKQIQLLSLLDTYTSDISSNYMEKEMLDMVISRRIGIDNKEVDFNKFDNWYKKQSNIDVDHLLKLVVNKGRKFTNNFNKFYNIEKENNKSLYEENSLYEDFSFSI